MNCPLHVGTQMVPLLAKQGKPLRGRWKGRGKAILVSAGQTHYAEVYDELNQTAQRLHCPIEGCPKVNIA